MILDLLQQIDKFEKHKYQSFEHFIMACNNKRYAIVSTILMESIKSDPRLDILAPYKDKSLTTPNKFADILGCEVFTPGSNKTRKIEDGYFYTTEQVININ